MPSVYIAEIGSIVVAIVYYKHLYFTCHQYSISSYSNVRCVVLSTRSMKSGTSQVWAIHCFALLSYLRKQPENILFKRRQFSLFILDWSEYFPKLLIKRLFYLSGLSIFWLIMSCFWESFSFWAQLLTAVPYRFLGLIEIVSLRPIMKSIKPSTTVISHITTQNSTPPPDPW